MNDMYTRNREIDEAIEAGNSALRALSRAEQNLSSARSLGLWDIFGGRGFSSFLKHSKMEDAQRCIEEADYQLQRFSRELQDVQIYGSLNVRFDGFTQFLDIFCDNVLVDVMVQSRINEAQRQVEETSRKVRDTIRRLEQMRM